MAGQAGLGRMTTMATCPRHAKCPDGAHLCWLCGKWGTAGAVPADVAAVWRLDQSMDAVIEYVLSNPDAWHECPELVHRLYDEVIAQVPLDQR